MPWSKKEKVQGRSQVGEDPIADPDAFTTIGSKTTVGNTEPILGQRRRARLPPARHRQQRPARRLADDARTQPQEEGLAGHLRELLDDPRKTTSLVLVTALIPPGARKDDRSTSRSPCRREQDDQPPGRHAAPCELFTSDTTGNLKSMVKDGKPSGAERRPHARQPVGEGRGAGRSPGSSSRRTASPPARDRTPTDSRSTARPRLGRRQGASAPGRTTSC